MTLKIDIVLHISKETEIIGKDTLVEGNGEELKSWMAPGEG